MVAISSLMALLTISCQKDKTETTTTFTATLEGCSDENGKTTMAGTTMYWVSGDQIKAFGTMGSGVYAASNVTTGRTSFNLVSGNAGGGPFHAVYPASAANDDGTVELHVV